MADTEPTTVEEVQVSDWVLVKEYNLYSTYMYSVDRNGHVCFFDIKTHSFLLKWPASFPQAEPVENKEEAAPEVEAATTEAAGEEAPAEAEAEATEAPEAESEATPAEEPAAE